VAALEGALILALAEGCPTSDEGLVVVLGAFEGSDNTLKAEERHKAPELKVDGRSVGFTGDVGVHGVKLLVVVTKLFIKDIPDKRLVHVILVDALLALALGAGMGGVIEHWSVKRMCQSCWSR
jgi:hypothetical protein